jgi:predicted nuclease of predicted toxin-antitoxin system
MARFLIDVNLPYYFALWRGPDYLFVRDLGDAWTDAEIWSYARAHGLTIVTKDADFSDRVGLDPEPCRVIHIRLGNLVMRDFHAAISGAWSEVVAMSDRCLLVQVFADRIEGAFRVVE